MNTREVSSLTRDVEVDQEMQLLSGLFFIFNYDVKAYAPATARSLCRLLSLY